MKRKILCSLFAILLSVSGQARADWFPGAVVVALATAVGTVAVKSIAAVVAPDEAKAKAKPVTAVVPVENSTDSNAKVEPKDAGNAAESDDSQQRPVDVMAEAQKRYEVLNPQLEKIADEQNTVGNAVIGTAGRLAAGRMISGSAAANAMFAKRFQ